MSENKANQKRSKFPPLFWLVVVFEFFERGSYYGMMSVLSVYLTGELGFSKPDVGLIKGTIQPLLYFLPILSGALADRFGYRRLLMVAFSLLGGGYFLTSQAYDYAAVFLSLVVMGLGAGTFKPIISGSIARCTDETNSTLGFGIFYWSINLGALLFPLFMVPVLRDKIGWDWVFLASAIGTGAMLIPTFFFFREPPKPKDPKSDKTNLLQTLANAFEIIYSPIILLFSWMQRSRVGFGFSLVLLFGVLGFGAFQYINPPGLTHTFSARKTNFENGQLLVVHHPNLSHQDSYKLENRPEEKQVVLTIYKPDRLAEHLDEILSNPNALDFDGEVSKESLASLSEEARRKTILDVRWGSSLPVGFELSDLSSQRIELRLQDKKTYLEHRQAILDKLASDPRISFLLPLELDELVEKAQTRPFVLFFVGMLALMALGVLGIVPAFFRQAKAASKVIILVGSIGCMALFLWLLPGLSLFSRILCSILSLTLLALFYIDTSDRLRFKDHFRFLGMVVIYSGFWILYFQMFDSVLWYVQAYVDATALNDILSPIMNGIYALLGLQMNWRFDVEFVTAINAFTIVCLQLLVSAIVKRFRAMPTMITGICIGTLGMAILAISTGIWVFLLGIIIFSIGEMIAHPKFISYVGETAPKSRVAMYMGYLFLYGVIGSSIGGVVGANLYVKFVDEMNQPRTLWLIFASIGVITILGLLIYNRMMQNPKSKPEQDEPSST